MCAFRRVYVCVCVCVVCLARWARKLMSGRIKSVIISLWQTTRHFRRCRCRAAPPLLPAYTRKHPNTHTHTQTRAPHKNADKNPNCQKNKCIIYYLTLHIILFPFTSSSAVLSVANVECIHISIAFRQGKIISKIGIARLLLKYDFQCLDDKEIEFENHSVVLVPRNGINLRVTNRPLDSFSWDTFFYFRRGCAIINVKYLWGEKNRTFYEQYINYMQSLNVTEWEPEIDYTFDFGNNSNFCFDIVLKYLFQMALISTCMPLKSLIYQQYTKHSVSKFIQKVLIPYLHISDIHNIEYLILKYHLSVLIK